MTRRISRRVFIGGAGGAALAAGASTWAILATRDPGTTPANTPSPTSPTTPSSRPATLPPAPSGGRQVISAPAGFNFDTFDSQLTSQSSVVEILGRTHSRLMQWTESDGVWELHGDLAENWESQDPQTYTFRIDRTARWHEKAPLNGRAVTAEDVVTHFRRSLDIAAGGRAPLAQRYHQLAGIDSVASPGPGLVQFRLKRPDELFLDTLAGEFALIQAPEAVSAFESDWMKLDSDHVLGTGPWTFDWADGGVRFTAARGGHREALLDELLLMEPHHGVQRFIDGSLDEATAFDRREAAEIRAKAPATFDEYRRPAREIVMSSFFIGAPPWNNVQLVNAISAALARSELSANLFGGRAEAVRGVPRVLWGRDAFDTLEQRPGDHPGSDLRYSGAREMWTAAGGPGLGTVMVDFPSVFDPLYSASSIVIDQLNRVLGAQFRPAIETYTTISKRVVEGYYGNGQAAFWFGWGPPLSAPSPAGYYREFYAPGSPGQRSVGGPGRDAGPGRAKELIDQGYLGIVPWVHQYHEVFRVRSKSGPFPSPFWQQHIDYMRSNA